MSPDEAAAAVVLTVRAMLAPLEARLLALEGAGRPLEQLAADLAGVRERLAAAEIRPLLAGPPGVDGKDGAPGRDGLDGLGFEELAAELRDDRTIAILASREGRTKEIGALAIPWPLYRGVYQAGQAYAAGDCVTYGGSTWIARAATSSRPETLEGAAAWTLAVKRGRDGRDRRPT
jgi:integrin beta 3